MDESAVLVISDSEDEPGEAAVVISDSDVETAEVVSDSEDSESELSKKKKRKRKAESDEEYVPESPSKKTKKLKKPKEDAEKSGKGTKEGDVQKKPIRPKKAVAKEKAADTAASSSEKPKRGRKRKATAADSVESGDGKNESEEKEADAPSSSEKPKKGRKKKVTPASGENSDAKNEPQIVVGMEWTDAELVAELQQIELHIARNIIRLLDEDNTIPFIARYRKELTNDMPPEKLRYVKDSYDMVKNVKHKAETVMKSIAKQNKLTPWLERCIKCARSTSELDHIYAPYKPGSKRTLAERARQLGLEDAANAVMHGAGVVVVPQLVKPNVKGLDTEKEVELGLQHIIADVISKDKDVLDLLRSLKTQAHIRLESSKARAPASKVDSTKASASASKAQADLKPNKQDNKGHKDKVDVESKFENYFQFSIPVKFIKPHQVLAINRGESLKVLSVKVNVPDWVLNRLTDFCRRHWLCRGYAYELRSRLFHQSVNDAYTRLLLPLLVRQVRSELTQEAERAAVEVFATNLKRLLLTPPLRGKTILGIDPGYRNGCKLAITSATGDVLATDVIYPQFNNYVPPHSDVNAQKLRNLALQHRCDVIGLGNGTACRETETFLSNLIQTKWFSPLDMKYTIVSEQGASIYSCSPIAQKEFPGMNPNMISAVSLARRLQDPLAELVKIEPKHLGVGMYQHDVPEKQLSTTLDEVVVECVSFVGVDVNTASDCILRKIAGLNASRAAKIIEWRSSNGCFMNRQQIKKVKGIGAKTFEQCSGFIRILPETASATDKDEGASGSGKAKRRKLSDEDRLNPLDRTWIHPESYSVAMRFLTKCVLNVEDLGKPEFISKVFSTVQNYGISSLATELGISEAQMKLISEGLQQKPGDDLRSQFQEPLFRRELTSLRDLSPGTELTGRIQNVTHFGSFVDIGVGTDGLIPARKLQNIRPQLGDRVKVKVMSVDLNRQRISLELICLL